MTAYIDPAESGANKTWKRKARPAAPVEGNLWDAPAPSVPRDTSEIAADAQGTTKRAVDRVTILRALAWHPDGLTRDQVA